MKHLTVFLLLVSFTSCYKYEKEVHLSLPAKTQSGTHTLGFMLGNDVWQNYGQACNIGGCPENLQGRYYTSDPGVSVSAYKAIRIKGQPATYEIFHFDILTRFPAPGTYRAGDSLGVSYTDNKDQLEKEYRSSTVQPDFTVIITRLDTVAKIVSGEFAGKLFLYYSRNGLATGNTDSVVIKDGRFDVKLK